MTTLEAGIAENELIATALAAPEKVFPDMVEELTQSHLGDANNRIIWDCLTTMHFEGRLDHGINGVAALVKQRNPSAVQILIERFQDAPLSADWRPLALEIKQAHKRRQFAKYIAEATAELNSGQDVDAVIERFRGSVDWIDQSEKQPPIMGIKDLARLGFETMQARLSKAELPIPLPASWGRYKTIMRGGMWPGLHILVAGTGAGKTTFATQIALEAASQGHPTAYIGLELDETQIGLRLLGAQAGIEWSKLYLGEYSEAELTKTMGAIKAIERWPLFADFGATSGWPPSRLKTIAKELQRKATKELQRKAKGKTPFIILDFLQLVGAEPGERLDLRERIGKAAYLCRQIAKDYKVAVLVVSSSSRTNYALLSGSDDSKGPGFYISNEKDDKGNDWSIGRMKNPDALVGTGKESGEIEYAADSVTVLVKDQEQQGGFFVAVSKLRYGRPGYSSMRMEGCLFSEVSMRAPELKPPSNSRTKAKDKAEAKEDEAEVNYG